MLDGAPALRRTGDAVIDLDQPAQRRTPPFVTARVLVLVVVGSLLLGGVLGGVAVYAWWYRPLAASVEKAEPAVSVLLFAEAGVPTVDGEQRRVRLEAQVTVVNAGPDMVTVLNVRVEQPGVTVRSPERERPIEPGTALPVDVVVEWTCAADQPTALAASVSVETVDVQARKISPVTLDGTRWFESSRGSCARLG